MVQPGGRGRGDQGGRCHGRYQGGIYGRGGGPGHGRGGGGRGSQNHQQQQSAGEQAHPEAKKGPTGGCYHCQGDYYVREWPELTPDQKVQLFIQTQEGEDDVNGGDDDDYDANGNYHDGVCGINLDEPPRDVEVVGCMVSLGQNQSGHARPEQ